MLRDFLNALIALIFYSTVYVTGSEVYSYFRAEAMKSSHRGLGSMQRFNRKLTEKTYVGKYSGLNERLQPFIMRP